MHIGASVDNAAIIAVNPPLAAPRKMYSSWPGLLLALLIALLALLLGHWQPLVGAPVFGIVLGILARNLFDPSRRFEPGIRFGGTRVLQWSIVVLGCGLSLSQVARTGLESLWVTLVTMSTAFLAAWLLGRLLGVPDHLKILIGVGTAICGGSAIAAVTPIIRPDDHDTAFAISTIFLFNLVAVLLFPLLGHLMHMSDLGFGLWAGTAINDTSSVVAAGYSYGHAAGDYATIVKLTRSMLIIPTCLVLAIVVTAREKRRQAAAGLHRTLQPGRHIPVVHPLVSARFGGPHPGVDSCRSPADPARPGGAIDRGGVDGHRPVGQPATHGKHRDTACPARIGRLDRGVGEQSAGATCHAPALDILRDMNLHHLAVFNAIADTGSISAAAQRLRVSQPALSRELKDFEGRLGVTLFERLPRGMQMTHAGEVLHEYAVRLFDISRTAEAAIREIADARAGLLSIGASNTIGTYVLPRRLAIFRRGNPGVRITMFVGNTEQVSQGVADMRFTLGFIEGPLHVSGLVAEQFQKDGLVPVVAADDELLSRKRLSAADINGRPLLMREKGSGTRELITGTLDANEVRQGSVMEFGNTEALKQAAMHGGGIAWLPRISITSELEAGTLRILPINRLVIQRPLSLIRRANAHIGSTNEAFLKTLRAPLTPT